MRCETEVKVHFSVYGCTTAPAEFVENNIIPLLNCFYLFLKNCLALLEWVYFWVLYSSPWISFGLSHALYYCPCTMSWGDCSHLILLYRNCSICSGSFAFPCKFEDNRVHIYTNSCWDLIELYEIWKAIWGGIPSLLYWVFQYKHRMSHHVLVVSFFSFTSILKWSAYKFCTCLIIFVHKGFMLRAIINGI